jgi:hypothetical protein
MEFIPTARINDVSFVSVVYAVQENNTARIKNIKFFFDFSS